VNRFMNSGKWADAEIEIRGLSAQCISYASSIVFASGRTNSAHNVVAVLVDEYSSRCGN
jgi:hypothetical protein